MEMDRERTIGALAALGEQLDYTGGQRIELVVCGGTALSILGLVGRTTHDVDVFALAETDDAGHISLLPTDKLPDEVLTAAATVARDLGLGTNWLNAVAALGGQSLHDEWSDRQQTRCFGRRLVVHFLGRFDLVCLKLHAVVDRSRPADLRDLQELRPSDEEIIEAARWCLSQDAGETFPDLLKSCLEQIGYADVIHEI